MTHVKICGLTNPANAHHAAEMGADMLGFIFAPVSKRYIKPEDAAAIISQIKQAFSPHPPICIGVFVVDTTTSLAEIATQCQISGIDAAQLVGLAEKIDLSQIPVPSYICIRPATMEQALQEADIFQNPAAPHTLPTLQIDAFHPHLYGGTGQTTSKELARCMVEQTDRLMLAGGLSPDNVADYIQSTHVWAVDVASGTEASAGQKDPAKVRDFIQAAKSAI